MSRLTNKDCHKHEDFIFSFRNKLITENEINDSIYKKLKSLEDLEEEIGIDFITLSKILKQRFVYDNDQVKIELLGLHIKSGELYLYGFVEDTTHAVYLRLKDYGKTWTITKEKL